MDNNTRSTEPPESQPFRSPANGGFLGYPEIAPPKNGAAVTVGASSIRKLSAVGTPSGPALKPSPTRIGPPLPKRPKGRLFIGTVFLCVLASVVYYLFDSTLRYTAYGEVVGKRVDLTVRWPGVVKSLHVREGDYVRRGDLIARVDFLELRQRLEEIDDALRLERAELSSQLAMLRWEADKIRDTRKLALSDFYDKWSELLWEQSRLAELRMKLAKLEPIHREGAVSDERVESLRFQLAGQEKRVEQFTEAVRALKQRNDESSPDLGLEDRIQPTLAKIENLQAELQRTREKMREGEVRAPIAGRIIRTNRFVGESTDQQNPVAELFVDGSAELVVYLPQTAVKDYPIGRQVTLHINPIDKNVTCRVHRVAMEMQTAPTCLERYYRDNESLYPVYMRVTDSRQLPKWLALGSEVRLPRAEDISTVARLRNWWNGPRRRHLIEPPNPLRPEEPDSPVRTAMEPIPDGADAEEDLRDTTGHDGRTAGWIRRP